MTATYSIDSVWITLTYPNDIQENFKLKKPNVFEFGFRRVPRRPDYRDAYKRYQKGNYFYQLIANYSYEWHEMDLRKLLVAKEILLKFPPAFGQIENYNSAKVLLDNDSVPRNWFQGLVVGSSTDGDIVPQGAVALRFVGVDAYTEAQAVSLFGWNQDDVGDPDDEDPDPPTISEDVTADVFLVGGGGKGGDVNGNPTGVPNHGGGGGSGGLVWKKAVTLFSGQIDFGIGLGGGKDGGVRQGGNSWLNQFTAYGGGPGGYYSGGWKQGSLLDGAAGGGGPSPFTSSGTSGGNGMEFQGSVGEAGDGGGFPAAGGKGGGASPAYDGNLDPVAFTGGQTNYAHDEDGIDFSSVFGSYFASLYGDNGAFAGGGGGGMFDDSTGDVTNTHGGLGGAGNGGYKNGSPYDAVSGSDAIDGTGSGGGGAAGEGAPGGKGADGFVMFRVALADVDKISGIFFDTFDFDGYRHYVLHADAVPPPPPETEYQGSIEVTGPAASGYSGAYPEASINVLNSPSEQSTDCGELGGTKFNIGWKGTDYCMVLPVATPSSVRDSVVSFIEASVPGLSAVAATGFGGEPALKVMSDTVGTADNGESVTFGVPSEIEQNGPVFNLYEAFLSGGEDASSINEPVDILLGKPVFATTDNIVDDELASSIAQKIYDAMDAIDTNDVSVSKASNTITITSKYRLSIALDIGNTGFSYTITQMTQI